MAEGCLHTSCATVMHLTLSLMLLERAFSSMPDAGLTDEDPRWHWWYDTAEVREEAREVLSRVGLHTIEEVHGD